MAAGVATVNILGRPIVVLPYDRPGCGRRVMEFLSVWLVRLLFAFAFFAAGYGCAVIRN